MREIFEHTADLGVRARATTLPEVFEEAGRGLFEVIAGDLAQVRPESEKSLRVPGRDPIWLLFDFLSELHAAFEPGRWLVHDVRVSIDADGLKATATGEPYDASRHALAHEVKAITQHGLDVSRTPTGWEATFIVDI